MELWAVVIDGSLRLQNKHLGLKLFPTKPHCTIQILTRRGSKQNKGKGMNGNEAKNDKIEKEMGNYKN